MKSAINTSDAKQIVHVLTRVCVSVCVKGESSTYSYRTVLI